MRSASQIASLSPVRATSFASFPLKRSRSPARTLLDRFENVGRANGSASSTSCCSRRRTSRRSSGCYRSRQRSPILRTMLSSRRLLLPSLCVVLVFAPTAGGAANRSRAGQLARIDHVVDGDTVALTNGRHVRLVQIDTPEVYFSTECYGEQASTITKRLLPPGTAGRLLREPKTDAVDSYGRLLRYVVRVRGNLDVNVQLVRVG